MSEFTRALYAHTLLDKYKNLPEDIHLLSDWATEHYNNIDALKEDEVAIGARCLKWSSYRFGTQPKMNVADDVSKTSCNLLHILPT